MKPLPLLAFAAVALVSVRARAASDELSTGASLSMPFAPAAARGFGAWNAQAEYGLTESFLIGGEMGAVHSLENGALSQFEASPWLGLELDVVEWVPRIVSGPVCVLRVEGEPKLDFGGQLTVGLDYRLARSLSFGALYHFSATVGADGELLHRAGLRAMYHWGW